MMLNSKCLSVVSSVGVLALMAVNGIAHGNERGAVKATIGSATVTVDYGRPMLKGRDLMKMIQPGDVWRIGSDAPTTIGLLSNPHVPRPARQMDSRKHFECAAATSSAGSWLHRCQGRAPQRHDAPANGKTSSRSHVRRLPHTYGPPRIRA